MGIVDFHNHLIPGVDDGAQTIEESVAALQALARDGVTVIVASPHLEASITARPAALRQRLDELDAGFATLQAAAAEVSDVRVLRGTELLLDVPDADLSDDRLRLAGGPFFLMEFPFMTVPPFSTRVVRALTAGAFTPIIAHPERYRGLLAEIEICAQWRQNGAFLQVNGGSLLGRYGREARAAAFELLGRGWVDYLCSDYHARGPTLVAEYRSLLDNAGADEQSGTLMETNPARMLEGLPPLPVQPLRARQTLWRRVAGLFGS